MLNRQYSNDKYEKHRFNSRPSVPNAHEIMNLKGKKCQTLAKDNQFNINELFRDSDTSKDKKQCHKLNRSSEKLTESTQTYIWSICPHIGSEGDKNFKRNNLIGTL